MLGGGIAKLLGSSYVRAVAMLSTGQSLAAAVPLLAAPILGRLYLPADYGVLASYLAASNIIGAVSTFQLQQAILAEHDEQGAADLVVVCWAASIMVAAAAAVGAFVAYLVLAGSPTYGAARAWVLMLPATTVASGMVSSIAAFANRHGKYTAMARIPLISAITTAVTSILFGFFNWDVHGLFASYFIGQAITVWLYQRQFRAMGGTKNLTSVVLFRLRALGWRHREFVLYTLPSEFIGTFNLQMPVLAMSSLGVTAQLGAFTRARQLIAVPLMLIGSSIALVFRQRAAEQYRTLGSCRRTYTQTMVTLAVLGALPTIILMSIAPSLFRILLGPNWTSAGEIARILAPMLFLQLVCSPLANVFYICGYQREEFWLSVASFALIATTLALAMQAESRTAIPYVYSGASSIVYIVYILRGWTIAKREGKASR